MSFIRDPNAYGYINGKAVYSHEEFIYEARGFGAITSDKDLIKFAEKVTGGWCSAGWKQSFISYYLSEYALSHPYADLTHAEFAHLKELQAIAKKAAEDADKARQWKLKETLHWADNSVEEIWVDKDGIEKCIQIIAPHGDLC